MKRIFLFLLVCLLSATAATATAPPISALHVTVSGPKKGRPVLLIPGYVAPGAMWQETAARLSRTYRCYVVTLAGTGGTTPLQLSDTTSYYAIYARAIAEYVRTNHLKKPVLVAHQTGGMMALRAATQYPTLFGGLVLLEAMPAPFAILNPRLTVDSLKLPSRPKMMGMMMQMPQEAFLKNQKMFISTWATDTAQQRRILGWAAQADRATWAHISYESLVTDLRPALPQLRVPVLLLGIWSVSKMIMPDLTHDKVQPMFERQFVGAGAGAEVRLNDTAREFMMLDDLDWTVSNIEQYLTAHQ